MTIAEYIEQELSKRPKSENKEWLAEEMGVNFKTLCGWFKRNSFSLENLINIVRVMDLDLNIIRKFLPLKNNDLIFYYKKFFGKKAFVIEADIIDSSNKTIDEKINIELDRLSINEPIELANGFPTVKLSVEDINKLISGYELDLYGLDDNGLKMSFYIKEMGTSLVLDILNEYDYISNGLFMGAETIISENNVKQFLHRLNSGEYKYLAFDKESRSSVEILPGEPIENNMERVIYVRDFTFDYFKNIIDEEEGEI